MRGVYEEARKQIERGLRICREIGERDLTARCLNGLGAAPVVLDIFLGWAMLLSRNKPMSARPEQALELFALVQYHPAATSETKEKTHQWLLALAAELSSNPITMAKTQRQAHDWQAVASQLISQ
jgi:hypothetical protein